MSLVRTLLAAATLLTLPAAVAVAQSATAPQSVPTPEPAQTPAPNSAAGQAAAPVTAAPTDDPDQRVRCRRISQTGSLVRGERVCRTVAEWRRIAQAGNDRARDLVGTGAICSGGACGNGN